MDHRVIRVRHNLGVPANTVDVGGAGQITATATDPRQMQFGLHFRF